MANAALQQQLGEQLLKAAQVVEEQVDQVGVLSSVHDSYESSVVVSNHCFGLRNVRSF